MLLSHPVFVMCMLWCPMIATLLAQDWTTATHCSPACQKWILTDFMAYRTLLLTWFLALTDVTISSQSFPSSTGYPSKWVTFKIDSMVFKLRQTHQLPYLVNMIEEYKLRSLRSSSQLLLKESTFREVTGRCSFRYAVAKSWNSLPKTIRALRTLDSFT